MRRNAIQVPAACLAALLFVGSAAANPIFSFEIHDSPEGSPNGVWDDQWSSSSVFPEGEYVDLEPPYNYDCQEEWNASVAPIGDGSSALYAYMDPPLTGGQPDWQVWGYLSLRQTCWEAATVVVTLYRASAQGCPPCEELLSGSVTVGCASWPPTGYVVPLGALPSMYMDNERLLFVISSPDAQCTDIIWDCAYYSSYFAFAMDMSPVEALSWGTMKALYR
jgi:hypothetical protein